MTAVRQPRTRRVLRAPSAEDTPVEIEVDVAPLRTVPTILRADSPAGVYAALVLIGVGVVVLAVTWGRVAGTAEVARQLPLVVSGGLGGIALVVIGAAVLAVAIVRREAAARIERVDHLAARLSEIRDALEP